MTKLNKYQAHKATGKARSTIDKYLKEGKLSYEIDESGTTLIDTSELIRVFGELKSNTDELSVREEDENTTDNTLFLEVERLKLELQHKDEVIKLKNDVIERQDSELKNVWGKLELLSAPKQENVVKMPEPKSWLERIFRKVAN